MSLPPERWQQPKPPAEKQGSDIERPKTAWDVLNGGVEEGRVTVVTLQAGPTGEGYGYHHAFAQRLENGDIALMGVPGNMTVNHSIGGSQEGLQYRDDPNRAIEGKIDPAFTAVVHKDGSIEGSIPAEYGDLTKTATGFGYFYDRGVLGKLTGTSFLESPTRQISPPESK